MTYSKAGSSLYTDINNSKTIAVLKIILSKGYTQFSLKVKFKLIRELYIVYVCNPLFSVTSLLFRLVLFILIFIIRFIYNLDKN